MGVRRTREQKEAEMAGLCFALCGRPRASRESYCKECRAKKARALKDRYKAHWEAHSPYDNMDLKKCLDCLELNPRLDFTRANDHKDGLRERCRSCVTRAQRENSGRSVRLRNGGKRITAGGAKPERTQWVNLTRARKRIWWEIGVTPDMVDAKWVEQDGKCALCTKVLHRETARGCHVDHCHETGRFRGLLCGGCNVSLGHLGDNEKGLTKALAYVTNPQSKSS